MNVVLFGVDEDKDSNVWRAKVDNAFQLIAGRAMAIIDTFRLGRFSHDQTAECVGLPYPAQRLKETERVRHVLVT